jgi:hypothetical protein
MMSHIPYPLVPRISFRSIGAGAASVILLGCAVAAITIPEYFIFPLLCLYTLWGVSRAVTLGLLERLPDQDPLLDVVDEEDEAGAEVRSLDYGEIAPGRPSRIRESNEPAEDER